MKKYKWIAESNDGSYQDESSVVFSSKRACYNNMRDAVLKKMCRNTEFDEDFSDIDESDYIGYQVHFNRDYTTHERYSGLYTYKIIEVEEELKTLQLPKEQISNLVQGLELLYFDRIGNKTELIEINTLKNYLEAQL